MGERRGFFPETTPCPRATFSGLHVAPSPSPRSPEGLVAEEAEGLTLLLAVEAHGGGQLHPASICLSHREGLPLVLEASVTAAVSSSR